MRNVLLAIIAIPMLLLCSPALADRRVALVVGNGAYESVPALGNPTSDAAAMGKTLQQAGFEVVLETDLDQQKMAAALARFADLLNGADVGLFYYAGHALQYNGENYLISTNARLDNPFALNSDAIPMTQIVATMESSAKVNLILLDACRNNPFVDRLKQALPGSRSAAVSRGLAPIDPSGADTMIAFATSSNQTAADGTGAHSPFTQALLDNMLTPGLEVSLVMKRVIQDVRDTTLRKQNPEVLNRMASEFYFVPAGGTKVASTEQAPKDDFTVVQEAFRAAMAVGTSVAWRQFIFRYPDTSLSEFARQALTDAETKEALASQSSAGTPRTTPTLAPPAETTAGTTVATTTDAPAATQVAALPPLKAPEVDLTIVGKADQTTVTPELSAEVLAMQVQGELNRLGCDVGTPDGHWGRKSQQGLERFAKATKQDVASLTLIPALLDRLKTFSPQTCPVQCKVTERVKDNQCVAKTCAAGQRLSSKGNCYTPVATPKTPTKKKRRAPVVDQEVVVDDAVPRKIRPPVVIEPPESLCSLCN